jgi:hypothetical protein
VSERVIFWATITEPATPVDYTLVSPSFSSQMDLTGWIREHRTVSCEVAAWKRTIRGADFTDERLTTRDEPPADPARLRALLEDLARMIDEKKRKLDRKRVA